MRHYEAVSLLELKSSFFTVFFFLPIFFIDGVGLSVDPP